MGFSVWIYCRRKKRKELSHYTASFNYTPAEAGISNYLNQTEKYSMGGSTEGPIYSTIDATNEEMHGFTYAQHTSPTPYASTSITPCPTHTQGHTAASSRRRDTGSPSPGPLGPSKPKQKAMGKAVKTPSLTWMEALPPPPPSESWNSSPVHRHAHPFASRGAPGPHDPPRLSQADQQLSRYVRRLANHVLT
ncbi:hypothetical protein F7725_007382 [Dissostichus mawsoni]|uniref:Uncharacterized protein n=1 Tax=Dissostichus mawsoni TaxID=36200 RepID=A0A7J5XWM2_DISMA|nr:hypothetical protein F7725_007382 [Dissostichus mawsoni]